MFSLTRAGPAKLVINFTWPYAHFSDFSSCEDVELLLCELFESSMHLRTKTQRNDSKLVHGNADSTAKNSFFAVIFSIPCS